MDRNGTRIEDIMEPILDRNNLNTPRIQFAGEATHSEQHSSMHGAYNSGRREAARLNSFYESI
jgi:spermine oxidase